MHRSVLVRARAGARVLMVLAVGGLLGGLVGCAAVTSRPVDTVSVAPIPTGSIVPVPALATSYADLGAFGRYAKALDEEYRVKPDFADWDAQADFNCSWVANGDSDTMAQPSSFTGTRDEEVVDSHGDTIHPLAGKVWAASLSARCPDLLTDELRAHIEVEETSGLQWVKTVD